MGRYVEGSDRTQVTLLPECLDDYIGEDNPVRIVEAFVEEPAVLSRCKATPQFISCRKISMQRKTC